MELVKLRLTTGETAARRAAAIAERWRNMAGAIGGCGSWDEVGLTFEMEIPKSRLWFRQQGRNKSRGLHSAELGRIAVLGRRVEDTGWTCCAFLVLVESCDVSLRTYWQGKQIHLIHNEACTHESPSLTY